MVSSTRPCRLRAIEFVEPLCSSWPSVAWASRFRPPPFEQAPWMAGSQAGHDVEGQAAFFGIMRISVVSFMTAWWTMAMSAWPPRRR